MSKTEHNTKSRILSEAKKLFSSSNYEGISMNDIASSVKTTKAALYYHFKCKEDIVVEIMKNFHGDVMSELKKISVLPISANDKIKKIIELNFKLTQEGSNFSFFLKQGSSKGVKSLINAREEIRTNIHNIIEPIMKEALKGREKIDSNIASRLFIGILVSITLEKALSSCENKKNKGNLSLEEVNKQVLLFMNLK